MLKTKIFLKLFLITVLIQAQDSYNFIGTIQLSDKSLISYKIDFTINKDNIIKGKSITDFSGKHRTESEIEGEISNDGKKVSFKEIKNISTKSNYAAEDFCYVHVKNAKIRLRNNKSILQGHFYGRFQNNELCAEGDIYLVSEEFMFKKLNKIEKRIPEKHKEKINVNRAKKSSKMTILREDEVMRILSSSNSVKLNIWDGEKNDGDLISVRVNGEYLLEKFEITNKVKSVIIPIDKTSATIEIIAENEGSLPPNSARFSVTDYYQNTELETQLEKGKKATIKISKK